MRVLLDESVPVDLAGELGPHDVVTVHGQGWMGVQNGELLRRAQRHFDVFVTMDHDLEHVHEVRSFPTCLASRLTRA